MQEIEIDIHTDRITHPYKWVKNNERRPTENGVYKTINALRKAQVTVFRDGHRIIKLDQEPVSEWREK